ncbi:hypothetical protein MTO96_002123, partial [Rhipicephalus appendiculatus]
MWPQISGRWKAALNKVKHPCFPGKHLHFLCDAPHMIKCMRNHLHKHNVAQAGNCEVAYDHYRLLYKAEENQQLRIVPKLTQAHIEPDCLRKMNVHLAEQLLSCGTAIGLEFYRNQGLPGLENSKGTAVFTKELNDLFGRFQCKAAKRRNQAWVIKTKAGGFIAFIALGPRVAAIIAASGSTKAAQLPRELFAVMLPFAYFEASQVKRCLEKNIPQLVRLLEDGFRSLALGPDGGIIQPLRHVVPAKGHNG